MDKDFFKGKLIGDVIDEGTKILTKFRKGYDVRAVEIRDIWLRQEGPYTVFSDWMNDIVICFENGKPKALFSVYDMENVSLNGKRGLVTAVGHETSHQYWFDNGEYKEQYTR